MYKKILSLFTILFIISAIAAPVYADQTVFGPKDLKIGRWHVHLSSHRFSVDDPSDGLLTIVKNTHDKEIRGGCCFLNGKYIGLRNFLKGTGTFFEKDVNLRSNNRLTVFLRGTPDASIKIEIKKKGITPPPEVSLSADPATIYIGQSSTLSWTSTNADTCVIEPGIGSVDLNGSTTVSPTETTTYTITSTGPGGTTTDSVTITATPQITLTITSPSTGEILSRPDVMVQGTVTNISGFETGVTVNGIGAIVNGDQFVANHVPLQEGGNTIAATATDTQGYTTNDSVIVNVEPSGDFIKITALPESGVSPLEIRLRIDGSFSFTESSITYSGPGTVEFLESSIEEYLLRITQEGVYYFIAEVTGTENNGRTDTVAIDVMDKEELDAMLKEKWSGMRQALIAGDIAEALDYHYEGKKEKYESIYNFLGANLPALTQQMQDIELIYVEDNRAKYRINREHDIDGQSITITYYIYFIKDENGLWKIEKY